MYLTNGRAIEQFSNIASGVNGGCISVQLPRNVNRCHPIELVDFLIVAMQNSIDKVNGASDRQEAHNT
jgi:hypothetical protein